MARTHLYKSVFILCLLCVGLAVFAQENKSDTLTKRFNTYAQQNLQEKIYVHTDRDYYLTGETIWFAVYIIDEFHQPLALSKVAYIELLDRNNKPMLQIKVAVKDGFANGSLFLPATLGSDNYKLRAYTSWMKNYDSDFYFNKNISVVNPFVRLDTAITSTHTSTTVEAQFFPEGGNMIVGINNKVAFKVNDASGHGLDFVGALVNQHNDTVLHFSPLKFGIGNFSFVPMENTQYRAVIHAKGLNEKVFNLPQTQATGYAFHLEESSNKINVEVNAVGINPNSAEVVYLFIHAQQVVSKVEMKFIGNNKATFSIDRDKLQEGISHFTIFSQDLKPVCERLYFKTPTALLPIQVQSNQQQYEKRKKITLNINGNVNDHLSLAVVRMDSLANSSTHIADYFLLTSDLKGTIESPEYYLGKDSLTRMAQDNLMLTHGWSRFKWDAISKNENTTRYPLEYAGHIVTAIVKDEAGTPKANVIGYASSPSKIIRLNVNRSNGKGEVLFDMKNFFGSRQLILQTNTKTDSLYHIEVKDPFSLQFSTEKIAPFHLSSSFEKNILSRSVGMQVQDVYSKNENNKTVKSTIDSISFYGKADETYLLDDYTRFPVMEEVMREYVPGVLVRKHKDGFHFIVLDNVNRSAFRETPLVLLDGVPLFDEDEIMNFDPLKVKKLEVIARRYFIGPLDAPGVVSYTTYRGDLAGFQLNPKSVSLNYEGLQLQQEFYSPQYVNQNATQNRLPDFRSLLYWQPSVIIDANGKKSIEFYTSDLTGKYQVVVEGISSSGLVGSAVTTFEVK